jgi:hypothetical protein
MIVNDRIPVFYNYYGDQGAVSLPVVLYGCETWSFTLREECRLRFFENKVEEDVWALEGRGDRVVEKNS